MIYLIGSFGAWLLVTGRWKAYRDLVVSAKPAETNAPAEPFPKPPSAPK